MAIKQVNFRINDEEYQILSLIAESSHLSIAELSRKLIFEKSSQFRQDLALQLYQNGKIGLKQAWKIYGLSSIEFQQLMNSKNIELYYDEKLEEKTLATALSLDLKKHLTQIPI